jgi:pimeloyl-[acyl-carrier protein] methyl ester esterase
MRELVLVHGWGFGSGVWRPVVKQLAPDLRVHVVDLPGYGDTSFSPESLSDNATVCGWSLGALLALQWAARYPDKVARLILVGATPRFVQAPDWQTAQPPEMLDGFAAAVATDPISALRRFATLLNQGDEHARALTRKISVMLDERIPSSSCLLNGLSILRDTDLRRSIPDIRQPALVIHGERDSLIPLAAGRWLADRLPTGCIEVFAGAAHAPFLSNPQRFATLISGFANE